MSFSSFKRQQPISTCNMTIADESPDEAGHKRSLTEIHLKSAIDVLDEESARSLLLGAAEASPSLAALIREKYRALVNRKRSEAIDFDLLSKQAWKALHVTYQDGNGSRQYEMAGEAFQEVRDIINDIANQVHLSSSFATKRSALHTLRKIGKSILLTPDTLGFEVKNKFGLDRIYTDTMWNVVSCMSLWERIDICEEEDGAFIEKMKELIQISEMMGPIFNDLQDVLDLLESKDGSSDDDDQGDQIKSGEEISAKGYLAEAGARRAYV